MDYEKQLSETSQEASSLEGNLVDVSKPSLLSRVSRALYLDELFKNAENRGIERIPDEEKTDDSLWNAGSMWFGSNMVVPTFSIGVLGVTLFGLTFWPAFLVIIFFNILGSLAPAYFSTFGPYFGLRQIIMSRYWFGFFGVRVCAIFNIIACVGWTTVNTIVAAQLLHTVNHGQLPSWAGILIIIVLSFLVTIFGYKIVHAFEKWSWVPNTIIFLITAIQMGRSHTFTYGHMSTGRLEAGQVLSFGATVYGFATGWTSYASDYTVYMPKDIPRRKVFLVVLGGINFPLMLAMILGAACATGTTTSEHFRTNYAETGIGGLFNAILVDDSLHGFGQFCMVVLSISTVSNNVPNLYTLGFSAQTLWSKFQKIPRIVWSTIASGAALGIAIPAYLYFDQVMENFMNIIGYWLAIYTAIGISEHLIYQGSFKAYDFEAYDDPSRLPVGITALFAFACGIAGAVVGMSQTWWVGPIAKLVSPGFGDVGFELAFGFSFVAYNLTRPFEKKYFKR